MTAVNPNQLPNHVRANLVIRALDDARAVREVA
jgi:hypothetical protein